MFQGWSDFWFLAQTVQRSASSQFHLAGWLWGLNSASPIGFDHHCSLILRHNPRSHTFDKTAKSLRQQFGDRSALFVTWFEINNPQTYVEVVIKSTSVSSRSGLTNDGLQSLTANPHLFKHICSNILGAINEEYQRVIAPPAQAATARWRLTGFCRFQHRATVIPLRNA